MTPEINFLIAKLNLCCDDSLFCKCKVFSKLWLMVHSSTILNTLVLSETWLNFEEDWLDIEGYKAFHSIRRTKRGSGIAVLSDINFSSELIPCLTMINKTFESVCIEIILLKKKHKIV